METRPIGIGDFAVITIGIDSIKVPIIDISDNVIYIDNHGATSVIINDGSNWVVQNLHIPHTVSFESSENDLSVLPSDMMMQLLFRLNYKEITSVCVTDKAYMKYCENETFWILRAEHDYPGAGSIIPLSLGYKTWKELYQMFFDGGLHSGTADKVAGMGNLSILQWMAKMNPPIFPTVQGANMAAKNGHVEILEWLGQLDPPILTEYLRGIWGAASNGHVNVLDKFRLGYIRVTSKVTLINNGFNRTLLAQAVRGNQQTVIEWLMSIDNSMYPDASTANYACFYGGVSLLMWLGSLNPPVLPTSVGANEIVRSLRKNKPMQYSILEWLEAQGIIPDVRGANYAAESGRVDLLIWLKKRGILPTRVPTRVGATGARRKRQVKVLAWMAAQNPPITNPPITYDEEYIDE